MCACIKLTFLAGEYNYHTLFSPFNKGIAFIIHTISSRRVCRSIFFFLRLVVIILIHEQCASAPVRRDKKKCMMIAISMEVKKMLMLEQKCLVLLDVPKKLENGLKN